MPLRHFEAFGYLGARNAISTHLTYLVNSAIAQFAIGIAHAVGVCAVLPLVEAVFAWGGPPNMLWVDARRVAALMRRMVPTRARAIRDGADVDMGGNARLKLPISSLVLPVRPMKAFIACEAERNVAHEPLPFASFCSPSQRITMAEKALQVPVAIPSCRNLPNASFNDAMRLGFRQRNKGVAVGLPSLVVKRTKATSVVRLAALIDRAYAGVIHSEVTFRCGQGRALLTQRFRPAPLSGNPVLSQGLPR